MALTQNNTTLPADEHYSYDGVGNRLTDSADVNGGSWQYNANHQLTARPDISYGYDANGHTVSKTAGAEVTTYEYDIAERMSAVKRDGVTLGSYQYDPFGRRVKKVTSSGAVYFHYDDTGLLAEYDASGQLISEYQYQPGNHWMTHPLFKRDGATGKVHYYYNSHLGQPLKLFDKAGRTTWSARSQAFGQTDVVVNETANPLRFPGQYEDGETGLFYNWHRYYDSETGRYLEVDPLGLEGGLNVYLYASGNSLSAIDPLGLFSADPIFGAVYGLTGGWSPSQSTVNFSAGLGDGIIAAMTLGLLSGQDLRDAVDVSGGVNPCSPAYRWGYGAGMALGIAATMGVGAEALIARAIAGSKFFRSYGGSLKAAHAAKVLKGVTPNAQQAANLKRFEKKIPSNAKGSVELRELPNGGVAAQATSPGGVPGSKAVYEKQIDVNGDTVQFTKTTYDPHGNIVHVKDKLHGGTYP